ncbi:MAG: GNAT family N-acetyltransferase [Oscillospiraceae bacterium]|nr:GNAT family N-acetyltransferase [Oscillospiraceae bacterium]
MKIRTANITDSQEICRISSEDLGYPCREELVRSKLAGIDPGREAVFAAVDEDDSVIGYIHIEKYDVLYFETMGNILGLAVSGENRRKGIGRALLDRAEEWAKENGIMSVRLNSGITREGAHEFYRRAGYGEKQMKKTFIKRLG